MIFFGTRQHAQSRRRALRNTEGMDYFKAEWMESGEAPDLSPTIFMIEQPPNTRVDPHFHEQNQFQLFLKGGGTLESLKLLAAGTPT